MQMKLLLLESVPSFRQTNVKWSIICILFCCSCTQVEHSILIKNVNLPLIDTLNLDTTNNYSMYTIRVGGYVDDTIILNDAHKLSGKIDTVIHFDFYGE